MTGIPRLVNESSDRTVVWDATAPRHLALADALDVLIAVTGLRTPRIVADPSEPSGDDLLIRNPDALSEISAAEWHLLYEFVVMVTWQTSGAPGAWLRYANVLNSSSRTSPMTSKMISRCMPARHSAADTTSSSPSGEERAVIAVAGNREWTAGLDDGAARTVAEALGVAVATTQQLLITAITQGHLSETEANDLYGRLLDGGFWGPPDLHAEPT